MKVKPLSRVRLFATPWAIVARLLRTWDFPGKSTGVGCHFLLQGIFPAQGLNLGLPHCEQTPYHLSHQESLVLMGQPQMLCLLSPGSLGYESRVYFPSVAESHGHRGEENRPRIRSPPPPSSSCSASIMITTASRARGQRHPQLVPLQALHGTPSLLSAL